MSDAMSDELIAEAVLGKDADDFLRSDLGKVVIGFAEEEAREATEILKRVHPWRRRRITELQNQIWRAESFKGWLTSLIISGRQAINSLEVGE